jgi:hypothetical protein
MTVPKTASGGRRRLSVLLVATVMTVGLTGSWTLVTAVDRQERRHSAEAMDQRQQIIESAVDAEIRRYTETATDVASAIGAQSDLSAMDFVALTSNLSQERLPGITGVSLVVSATDSQIPQVQRQWRARGNPRLTLAAAGTGTEHLFVVLDHPFDGTPAQIGRDVNQSGEPAQALWAARTRKEVMASPTYVVPQDTALSPNQQQLSFVLAAPIYGGLGTPDVGELRGWLLMSLRGKDFITPTMPGAHGSSSWNRRRGSRP